MIRSHAGLFHLRRLLASTLISGLASLVLLSAGGCPSQSSNDNTGNVVGVLLGSNFTGRTGPAGLSCWDLNGNGAADPEEDINGDGNFDALDCQGDAGDAGQSGQGAPGAPGANGLACWDLNADGIGQAEEDINGDGDFNALDCQGPQGPTGPAGPAGSDGALGAYGDGSAGDVTIVPGSSGENVLANPQFNNFTIAAGAELIVTSGTVIRCKGTFTNNGTITVATGAMGGSRNNILAVADPDAGVSALPAGQSEFRRPPSTRAFSGASGGIGLSRDQSALILAPGVNAGGGGSAGAMNGSAGGGSLVVLAQAGIVSTGFVHADGAGLNGGGGGGGVVVFATPAAISNTGTITVRGGAGMTLYEDGIELPGGGGGGGIIHFLAPTITATGVRDVTGGSAGQVLGNPSTHDIIFGGGGGGACGGNGGNGASMLAGGGGGGDEPQIVPANPGLGGWVIDSLYDPTALF